jgi:hypothetical protein
MHNWKGKSASEKQSRTNVLGRTTGVLHFALHFVVSFSKPPTLDEVDHCLLTGGEIFHFHNTKVIHPHASNNNVVHLSANTAPRVTEESE